MEPIVLDCRGQRCPLPVIELAKGIADVPVGGTLRVLADDPAAAVDIPAWCRMRGHTFIGETTHDEAAPAFGVRREH